MSLIHNEKESHNQIHLDIKKPTLRYLDEFIELKCAPDLLAQGLFPNAKEITESMAAFNAIRKNCIYPGEIQYDSTDTCIIDVGCGSTPRTAALCAMRTNWDCFGVDPKLNNKDYTIERLKHEQVKLEDFVEKTKYSIANYDNHIYIATHAHIPFIDIANYLARYHIKKSYLIYMPCCNYECAPSNQAHCPPLILELIADYEDYGIHSPYRRIYVYKLGE